MTGAEADKAIKEAERLGAELAAAAKLPDAELEKAVNAIKQVSGAGIGERGRGGETKITVLAWTPVLVVCCCGSRCRVPAHASCVHYC